MMTKQFVKYGNRKLYSRDRSSYVNLTDIVAEVRSGANVVVICDKTKHDVTDSVLAQAVILRGINRETAISLLRA